MGEEDKETGINWKGEKQEGKETEEKKYEMKGRRRVKDN